MPTAQTAAPKCPYAWPSNPPPVWMVDAIYSPAELPDHAGNPALEALPPLASDDVGALIESLQRHPPLAAGHRLKRKAVRRQMIVGLTSLVHPLDEHVKLAFQVDAALRSGYLGRNPMKTGYH